MEVGLGVYSDYGETVERTPSQHRLGETQRAGEDTDSASLGFGLSVVLMMEPGAWSMLSTHFATEPAPQH